MVELNKKKVMQKVEIVFDLTYLFTVLIAAGLLLKTAEIGSIRFFYALMSFVLGFGDAFHLIPRISAIADKKGRNHSVTLGIGKFITSITMTIFYLFLWEIGLKYYELQVDTIINAIVYGLGLLRVLLCILPHNKWTKEKGPLVWAIIRNIPFVALGLMVITIYIEGASKTGGNLNFVWIAILISFLCYIPVVVLSNRYPKIGMLMLPKSCAYAAIVLMGFAI